MKTLYVYADFDWIEETELVGELGYESLVARIAIVLLSMMDVLKKTRRFVSER